MTAIRIALGFLCTLCVAAAAETGNIPAKIAPVAVVKQGDAKLLSKANSERPSFGMRGELSLSRHTSSFNGPVGPTLAVGARYVQTPTPGLRRLDNFGQISKGEYVYDWPPGAKIIAGAPSAVKPAVVPTMTTAAPAQAAGR